MFCFPLRWAFFTLLALLLTVAPHPSFAAPLAVTDTAVSFRTRVESRDDRFFKQFHWGDKEVTPEWRLRGAVGLTYDAARLDLELQDQRVLGSHPPVWLDVSPMAAPFTTFEEAGLRLTGGLTYQMGRHRLRAGRFPIEAAGGRLLGADEYRVGYRPYGVGWSTGEFAAGGEIASGATVWAGTDTWDPVVGNTTLGLARYGWTHPRYTLETGVLGRRAPSRPRYAGVAEATLTPYIFWAWDLGRRVSTEVLGAYQIGDRAYRPIAKASKVNRDKVKEWGLIGRPAVTYVGDRGERQVRAYYVRTTAAWRIPIAWDPVWSAGFHLASGGGTAYTDRDFVPFHFDTHRFFGNAGYFGPRNARSVHTALEVPLFTAWTARVAVWRMHVVSPREGIYLENGAQLDPARYPEVQRKQATSHDALREWDAELRWQPATNLALRLSYSEIRHGLYLKQVIDAAPEKHRAPPAQWAAFQVEYSLRD
jgi:hypothetical protein